MVVTNLFAFRATDPRELMSLILSEPALAIGEGNDTYIHKEATAADLIVLAWGDNIVRFSQSIERCWRDAHVIDMLRQRDLFCIRRTNKGNPAHPVRERYTQAPEIFLRAQVAA
jgi:hypothetical protein